MTTASNNSDYTARILIVDDEPPVIKAFEQMLANERYLVLAAASAEEALAIVAQRAPDLILSDIRMGDIDGYELVRRLKSESATKNIPIIMISGLEDVDARMRALNVGAEDFLTKPVDRAELIVRVRNLLRLKANSDYVDQHNQVLEREVAARTADLRCERDRAQRYLDTAEIILLALDLEGRITLINRYGCSILGWSCDELIGREWIPTCIPPSIREEFTSKFRNVLDGDLSLTKNALLTKNGDQRLIEWRNTLLRDEAGSVIGTLSSGTDVTDRDKAVEATRVAEERMRFALEAAGVGIWDIDFNTGVLQWSETLLAQYGVAPGMFGGTFPAFVERIHPDDRESVLTTIHEAETSGADFTLQHRSLWPDGSVHWMSGAGRIVIGEGGRPTRGVGISQDITARIVLERQYQQAQKMEAIGKLASGVAHDFNNLLTVILGFSEMIVADADLADQHKKDLAEITAAANRASGLTKQLLAFSRQQVLKTAPLDLNALLTDLAGMVGRLIGAPIEVVVALVPQVLTILADRGQIEQVVMNLVVNARDAMPEGGTLSIATASVELSRRSLAQETVVPGPYVRLTVTDTGTGMSQETLRHLFEPFFTTKKPGEGTGLGLSTAYGIITQSNGYIEVASELGRGTTFCVYLPSSDGDVIPTSRQIIAPAAKRPMETVLLVEDEEGVRLLSTRVLARAGYRVLQAGNVAEAEGMFASHRDTIDLVITDVIMPDGSGPELVGRLQAHVPGLRVLYMSGYTEQSPSHREAIDLDHFVQKPFTPAELLRHVGEALAVQQESYVGEGGPAITLTPPSH